VRYALKTHPLVVHACHCRDCQRLTGAVYAVNAWIEEDGVELLSGELSSFRRQGDSGRDHDVYSCSNCGTVVWTVYHGAVGCLFVRVGTFDDSAVVSPHVHIYTRSKHPSVILPDDVPSFEGYYPSRNGVWPEESLARFKAAKAAKG
jgi:hypothetical protein